LEDSKEQIKLSQDVDKLKGSLNKNIVNGLNPLPATATTADIIKWINKLYNNIKGS